MKYVKKPVFKINYVKVCKIKYSQCIEDQVNRIYHLSKLICNCTVEIQNMYLQINPSPVLITIGFGLKCST